MCNTIGLKGLEHWNSGTSTESNRLVAAAGSTQENPATGAVPSRKRSQCLGDAEVRNGENEGRLTVHCYQHELSLFRQGQSFAWTMSQELGWSVQGSDSRANLGQ